uniref:Trace amine-associated receptor 9-like n=1 Tax=Actinia tenebrosa TaxID=6105 RepID=A0A6P8IMH6_ACTTE
MANSTTSPSYNECNFSTERFDQLSTNLTQSSRVTLLSFAVLNGLAALPTFMVNLLVTWTVLESPRLRSSNYNILVAILSFSDMLTGLVGQPLFVSFSACHAWDCVISCKLKVAFSVTSVLNTRWTLATLAIVCVERYLYIHHPLKYSNKVTIQKSFITVVVSWFTVAVGAAVQKIEHKHAFFVRRLVGLTFLLPVVAIIVFCSIKMHLTLRRQRRAIAVVLPQGVASRQSKVKEFKRIDVFQIALLIFALQYSPLVISQVFWTLKGPGLASSLKIITSSLTVTCIYSNSLINPFLYSIRLSDIRKGVRSKLPRFRATDLASSVVRVDINAANRDG